MPRGRVSRGVKLQPDVVYEGSTVPLGLNKSIIWTLGLDKSPKRRREKHERRNTYHLGGAGLEQSGTAARGTHAIHADPLVEHGGRLADVRARQGHPRNGPFGGHLARGGGEDRAAPDGAADSGALFQGALFQGAPFYGIARIGARQGERGEGKGREAGDELGKHGGKLAGCELVVERRVLCDDDVVHDGRGQRSGFISWRLQEKLHGTVSSDEHP